MVLTCGLCGKKSLSIKDSSDLRCDDCRKKYTPISLNKCTCGLNPVVVTQYGYRIQCECGNHTTHVCSKFITVAEDWNSLNPQKPKEIFNTNIRNILEKFKLLWHVVDRNKEYHPEENVLVHCLQAMETMKKFTKDPIMLLAAAFHDIGKDQNPAISLQHPNAGYKFLKENGVSNALLLFLIHQHMRIHLFLSGEMSRYSKVMEIMDGPHLKKQILLHRCDTSAKKENHRVFTDKEYRDKLVLELGWYLETII